MNISEILANPNYSSGYAQQAGMVFVMRCVPDPFTQEQFNIGVCGVDQNGRRVVKVVTEPGRLQCLYGESAVNVVLLAQAAAQAAQAGAPSPSPQVVFDEPTPFYNASLEDLVNSTFVDQVTVALPQRASAGGNPLDDEEATRMVTDAIKNQRAFDMDLLANTPQVLIQTERGMRTLRVPLQPPNGVGTIRSAFYSPQTLRMHLMDSVLDMECAARYRKKGHMGLFILRPAKATRDLNKQLDAVIDGVAFRAPRAMLLEVGYNAEELATAVSEWGGAASEP